MFLEMYSVQIQSHHPPLFQLFVTMTLNILKLNVTLFRKKLHRLFIVIFWKRQCQVQRIISIRTYLVSKVMLVVNLTWMMMSIRRMSNVPRNSVNLPQPVSQETTKQCTPLLLLLRKVVYYVSNI